MFRGTGTALVTPFCRDGSVDKDALRRLVDLQEENGIRMLVPCGSTGEAACLTHKEQLDVIATVIDQSNKARVIAGAGSNSTAEAVMLSKGVNDLGADGILSISPYYNKPTQAGIYQHYEAIAAAVDIPVVVYNIPGRTGSNITAETMLKIAEVPGIDAVKEASGKLDQIRNIIENRPSGFSVLSGDDSLTSALINMGGDGVISVTSNCLPNKMSSMVDLLLAGKKKEASAIEDELRPMFRDLFIESNPIPIKYVMARMGYGYDMPRLPLMPLSEKGRKILNPVLTGLGL